MRLGCYKCMDQSLCVGESERRSEFRDVTEVKKGDFVDILYVRFKGMCRI